MTSSPGELLREARCRHGVTQAQLAARAGTTQSSISRVERNNLSPTVETLGSLLRLIGEDLDLKATEIETGHDRAMLRQNLALSPSERLARGVEHANFVLRNRGGLENA